MSRRDYAGGAQPTKSVGTFTAADPLLSVVSLVGWPDGVQGPFAVSVDRDTPNEEKILCDSVNGNDLSVVQRGYDGTTARDHSAGATVEHVFTSIDADEANDHVNRVTGVHGIPVAASVVGTTGTQTLTGKTLDFAPGTGNVATNLPVSASPAFVSLVDTEEAERVAADTDLANDIAAETSARQTAVTNEAATRAAADADRYTKAEADAIHATQNARVPVGTVVMFAGPGAPAGWLLCDGSAFSNVTYPELATLLGVQTTPNLSGKVPRGVGPGYPLAGVGGADTRVLTAANLPAHAHTINHDHPATTGYDIAGSAVTATQAVSSAGSGANAINTLAAIPNHTHDVPIYSGNSGNGPGTAAAVDTRDPYWVINFIIRAAP